MESCQGWSLSEHSEATQEKGSGWFSPPSMWLEIKLSRNHLFPQTMHILLHTLVFRIEGTNLTLTWFLFLRKLTKNRGGRDSLRVTNRGREHSFSNWYRRKHGENLSLGQSRMVPNPAFTAQSPTEERKGENSFLRVLTNILWFFRSIM